MHVTTCKYFKIYTVCVCLYIYIINMHSTHTFIMYTFFFFWMRLIAINRVALKLALKVLMAMGIPPAGTY